jgi:SPX domain protein involved in polyphosphate accumulation
MRFGEELKLNLIYEWKDKFLNYEKLKEFIEKIETNIHDIKKARHFRERFKTLLTEEVLKVNEFYLDMENKFAGRQAILSGQIHKLVKLKNNFKERNV